MKKIKDSIQKNKYNKLISHFCTACAFMVTQLIKNVKPTVYYCVRFRMC